MQTFRKRRVTRVGLSATAGLSCYTSEVKSERLCIYDFCTCWSILLFLCIIFSL